jgi:hypothetical protein
MLDKLVDFFPCSSHGQRITSYGSGVQQTGRVRVHYFSAATGKPLSAAEVRRQLIAQKGYADEALPTVQTITSKLNALGYYPKKVAKSQPQKKSRKPTRSSSR